MVKICFRKWRGGLKRAGGLSRFLFTVGKNNKRIITKSRHKPSLVATLTTSRTAESSPGPSSPQRPQPQEEEGEVGEVGEILEPQPSQLEPVLVKATGEKVEVRLRLLVSSSSLPRPREAKKSKNFYR